MKKPGIPVREALSKLKTTEGKLQAGMKKEKQWLQQAMALMTGDLESDDKVAWSAYHASQQKTASDIHAAISQLLPLFFEKAATAAMIKHGMNILQKSTHFLNPGQIPVIALDAPLYALAKQVQWTWPQTHGEDKFVIMCGGLHVEMAMWRTFGDYLEGSGWTAALTQAGVASSGTSDSFLHASHLPRTRHAHQVSALALARLQEDAFLSTQQQNTTKVKEDRKNSTITKSPTFQYWNTIMHMELLGLVFIRAHRKRDFPCI